MPPPVLRYSGGGRGRMSCLPAKVGKGKIQRQDTEEGKCQPPCAERGVPPSSLPPSREMEASPCPAPPPSLSPSPALLDYSVYMGNGGGRGQGLECQGRVEERHGMQCSASVQRMPSLLSLPSHAGPANQGIKACKMGGKASFPSLPSPGGSLSSLRLQKFESQSHMRRAFSGNSSLQFTATLTTTTTTTCPAHACLPLTTPACPPPSLPAPPPPRHSPASPPPPPPRHAATQVEVSP